jgi:low affinity Fe/Cu permease
VICLLIFTIFSVGGRTTFLLLNVYRVSDIRQIQIHIDELLVHDSSPFEVEIAIAKHELYKAPRKDQILVKLIQAGGETLWSEIYKLINSNWNKEELPDQ